MAEIRNIIEAEDALYAFDEDHPVPPHMVKTNDDVRWSR
jgi:hypothetical protein